MYPPEFEETPKEMGPTANVSVRRFEPQRGWLSPLTAEVILGGVIFLAIREPSPPTGQPQVTDSTTLAAASLRPVTSQGDAAADGEMPPLLSDISESEPPFQTPDTSDSSVSDTQTGNKARQKSRSAAGLVALELATTRRQPNEGNLNSLQNSNEELAPDEADERSHSELPSSLTKTENTRRLPDVGYVYSFGSPSWNATRRERVKNLITSMLDDNWNSSKPNESLSVGFEKYVQAERLGNDPRIPFAYALLLERHLHAREALQYLTKANEISAIENRPFLRPRRRLVLILGKLRRWEELALECQDLMKDVRLQGANLAPGVDEEYAQFVGDVYGYLSGPLESKLKGEFDLEGYAGALPRILSPKQIRQFEFARTSALEKFANLSKEDDAIYEDLKEKAPVTHVSDRLANKAQTTHSVRTPLGNRYFVSPYYRAYAPYYYRSYAPYHVFYNQPVHHFFGTLKDEQRNHEKSQRFDRTQTRQYDKQRRIRIPKEAYAFSNYVRSNLELEKRLLLDSLRSSPKLAATLTADAGNSQLE